jgi:hypothetical protein
MLCAYPGCHRNDSTQPTDEVLAKSKPQVSFADDRGVTVDSFEVGDSVFASVSKLQGRTLYTVELHGPVEMKPPTAPSGPSGTPAAGPAPTGGATPAKSAANGGGASAKPAAGTTPPAKPAEGGGTPPSPPPQPPTGPEPGATAPAPTAGAAPEPGGSPTAPAGPSAPGGPAATAGPTKPDAKSTTPEGAPAGAPPPDAGPLVSSARWITDADGRIPETELARGVGELSGEGPGQYAIVLIDPVGREAGRATFPVGPGTHPTAITTDTTGRPKLRFAKDKDSVYLLARRLKPSSTVAVFVTKDRAQWDKGTSLESVNGGPHEVLVSAAGDVKAEIWQAPDKPGGYDVVIDVDGDGAYSDGDVVTGVRTTGLVVTEPLLNPTENHLTTPLACGSDYYSVGARGDLSSKEGVYIRGVSTHEGGSPRQEGVVYVCPHVADWENGTPLRSRAPQTVRIAAGDAASIPRTLVWPGPVLPGQYDIIVDEDGDGKYTKGTDLLDNATGGECGVVVKDAGNLVTVHGKVVDPDGKPVSGAVVSCDDSGAGSTTTSDTGEFALAQVLPLQTRVRVVAAGLAPAEQTISPAATDASVQLGEIKLAAGSSTGNPYFPLVDGGEWKYDLKRTITTDTSGPVATSAKVTEDGTLLRSLAKTPDGGFTLSEEESVTVEGPTGSTAAVGETKRNRTMPLVLSPDGLERGGETKGLLVPAKPGPGSEFAFGPFDCGGYEIAGNAKVESGGSVDTSGAGSFPSCLLVTVTPTTISGPGMAGAQATGTVRIWLAPDVGEVKREVELSVTVAPPDPSAGPPAVKVTVHESLVLMHRKPPSAGSEAPAAPAGG